MASCYRKFLPEFATIADTLTHLTKRGVAFSWSEEAQSAFEQIKALIASGPILHRILRPSVCHPDRCEQLWCMRGSNANRRRRQKGLVLRKSHSETGRTELFRHRTRMSRCVMGHSQVQAVRGRLPFHGHNRPQQSEIAMQFAQSDRATSAVGA